MTAMVNLAIHILDVQEAVIGQRLELAETCHSSIKRDRQVTLLCGRRWK
jgi:hypothetical protein